MKLYNQKAHVYHELYKEIFDYEKEFSMFHDVLKNHSIKVSKVLELGCGSGSVTKYFMEEYECVGLDLSPDMINIAEEIYPKGNFMQGDMRDLPSTLNDQFDVVVSTGRSFTHLTTNKDCLDCCNSVFRVLKPGGIFVFDNFNAQAIFTNFKPVTIQKSKYIKRKSTNTQLLENGFTWNWYAEYEITDENGELIETFVDYTVLRAFTGDELRLLLTLAGFKDVQIRQDIENPISLLSIGTKSE
jgi:ubiquinone/menaquinone biosynthesis C-methylase UbiE